MERVQIQEWNVTEVWLHHRYFLRAFLNLVATPLDNCDQQAAF